MPHSVLPDEIAVALQVARALEALGIPYFLGGSMASSMQGEPRSTNDVDIVVDLAAEQVEPLVRALGPDFEVDAESLLGAVRRRNSWNIFHLPSALKVDLFIARMEPFDLSELERRTHVEVVEGAGLYVKSPEDSVLRKLLWFRQGGEVSSQQWRDVVEILRVSKPLLNQDYLRDWAARLGIDDLLSRAAQEAARG